MKLIGRPFPFMKLPKDIRLMVYEHCIPTFEEYDFLGFLKETQDKCYDVRKCTFNSESTRQPAILKIDRKVRSESLPIFYGTRRFRFHEPGWNSIVTSIPNIDKWFSHIGPQSVQSIRHVILNLDCKTWLREDTVSVLSKLKNATLECHIKAAIVRGKTWDIWRPFNELVQKGKKPQLPKLKYDKLKPCPKMLGNWWGLDFLELKPLDHGDMLELSVTLVPCDESQFD